MNDKKLKKLTCTPHTQIIHFIGGYKRTIYDVRYIWENEMTHLIDGKGVEWIINKPNVLAVEKYFELDLVKGKTKHE